MAVLYRDPYFPEPMKTEGILLQIKRETSDKLFSVRTQLYRLFMGKHEKSHKLRKPVMGLRRGKKFELGQKSLFEDDIEKMFDAVFSGEATEYRSFNEMFGRKSL